MWQAASVINVMRLKLRIESVENELASCIVKEFVRASALPTARVGTRLVRTGGPGVLELASGGIIEDVDLTKGVPVAIVAR